MAETAAALTLCDLTIAVDTSVAHLAGALARPAWVMLPFSPDWRGQSPGFLCWLVAPERARRDWPGVVAQAARALAGIRALGGGADRWCRFGSGCALSQSRAARWARPDLGVAHLARRFAAHLRRFLVAAHGRDVEPLVRLDMSIRDPAPARQPSCRGRSSLPHPPAPRRALPPTRCQPLLSLPMLRAAIKPTAGRSCCRRKFRPTSAIMGRKFESQFKRSR